MHSRLFIEDIASEESLRQGATYEDVAYIEQYSNCNRRREVLAWRAIVRRELGRGIAIGHDEHGAPRVDLPDTYISVSHSRGVVAVMIADAPCAVDVEQTERDFAKVASKYLSDAECLIAEQYNLYAEMWSTKEALYKYYKKGGLDLVRDVVIREYNPSQAQFVASVCGGAPIVVNIARKDNLVMATIE